MSWIVENTVFAAGLALCVIAGCRIFRPRPALAHLLWLFVLAKLVCPPIWLWSWPVSTEVAVAERAERALTPLATVARESVPLRLADVVVATPAAPAPVPHESAIDWLSLCLGFWGIGSAIALLSLLVGVARVCRLRRLAIPLPESVRREVDALASRMRIATPVVHVVPGLGSAFVVSFLRPRLFLPAANVTGDGSRRRTILAHELAHIRRRDHWVAWFEIVATVGLWWHPLVWFARGRMRQHAELACDAWTIWAEPEARCAYAGALIDALETEAQTVATLPALGARPSVRRAFERRLEMILKEDTPRRLSRWAIVPVFGLSVAVLSGFTTAQDRGRRKDANLEKTVRAEVLRVVNEELRKKLGSDYEVRDVRDVRRAVREYLRDRMQGNSPRDPVREKPAVPAKPRKLERAKRSAAQSGARTWMENIAGQALREARREIRDNEDLRRLGLTKDVEALVEGVLSGQGAGDVGSFVQKAMRIGMQAAKKELRGNEDLRKLGITGDVERLVESMLGGKGDAGNALQGLIKKALRGGLEQAKREIRKDSSLREMRLTDDVEKLVESVLGGKGDFGSSLENVIRKSIDAAQRQGRATRRSVDVEAQRIERKLEELRRKKRELERELSRRRR